MVSGGRSSPWPPWAMAICRQYQHQTNQLQKCSQQGFSPLPPKCLGLQKWDHNKIGLCIHDFGTKNVKMPINASITGQLWMQCRAEVSLKFDLFSVRIHFLTAAARIPSNRHLQSLHCRLNSCPDGEKATWNILRTEIEFHSKWNFFAAYFVYLARLRKEWMKSEVHLMPNQIPINEHARAPYTWMWHHIDMHLQKFSFMRRKFFKLQQAMVMFWLKIS